MSMLGEKNAGNPKEVHDLLWPDYIPQWVASNGIFPHIF